jgi:hypothetical protein
MQCAIVLVPTSNESAVVMGYSLRHEPSDKSTSSLVSCLGSLYLQEAVHVTRQ